MKRYTAQVKMSYYVWVAVDASDEHSARDRAIRVAWSAQDNGYGVWGEEPEVIELKEGEAK